MERIATATFTRMAKRLLVLIAVLAAMLAAAVPVFAQEQDSATGYDPEQDFYSTLTFELEVEGEPPAGTEFFGAVSGDGGFGFVPLSDPDGDGTYSGSTEVFKYVPGAGPGVEQIPMEVPVRIGQATGTPAFIGQLDTIEDFGAVPLDEDRTFSASVSFDEDAEGPTTSGAPSPQDRTTTFDFELTVKGTPPEDARFFGAVPAEGCISVPLADPDGDGVFTGSLDVPRFAPGPVPPGTPPVSLPVQIVQADSGGGPCNPTTVIRDFGTVPADDNTFRARANFKENGGGTTTPEPGNSGGSDDSDGSGSGGSNNSGSSGSSGGGSDSGSSDSGGSGSGGSGNDAESSGSPSGVTSGIRGMLPSTGGGVALWVLGAGILLIGGGLLVRKLAR